ncbi:MAG: hypothetical protein BWY17_00310 [Deltaproteobacteria bacterium ADurb.Bin207]|jgi:hypothetical protein|nr:MAG: hypothetical protein BWY17_00310 [Deltaproteobacteria bacterium ADurb.Bin207]
MEIDKRPLKAEAITESSGQVSWPTGLLNTHEMRGLGR